jgi:hypothetical protein
MAKLRRKFSEDDWYDCCAKFCDDCKIARAYKKEFGKKEGKKKLKHDHKKFN